jgi:hypothetical protein
VAAEVAIAPADQVEDRWRPLVRWGAVAAIVVLVMIPLQATVFLLSPPPTTAVDYFALFQANPLLGLLDLDLLLTLDYVVMIPFYLALFVLLGRREASLALLALTLGLFSLALFFVSREATFSMWQLSTQYAVADEAGRAALRASGQTLLTLYNGGTFGLSYLLGATSTLLFSLAMLRTLLFGRAAAVVGLVTGVTMLVPPNTGGVGLVVAMLSLIPTAVWLVLLARGMLRKTQPTST